MNHKTKNINHGTLESGQAVITVVVLLLFVSVAVMLGLGSTAIKDLQITQNFVKSKQAYLTAESGVEDAAYRLKNGKQISSTETLALNGATTTTDITDISGSEKEILSTGDLSSTTRKVKMNLRTSTVGASFNYGIQVGSGGLIMSNNAGINGNVYANGNITGANGVFITGTAIAANTATLVADQVNDTPSTPSNSITFGDASGTQDFTQSFEVSTTSAINKIDVYIKKAGAPGNITARITTSTAGGVAPETSITTATISAASVTTSYSWVTATFSPTPDLMPGTTYWIVLDASTGNGSKNYIIGGNTNYATGTGKIGQFGGTWNNTSPSGLDGYFKLYLGGLTSTIDDVDVGTGGVGDAKAHTVTGSTIAGSLYCQTGSGNNKSCNTSQPDPTPQAFAISQGNIDQWKSDAQAGGTISGNYTPSGSSSSLGPKYITGDLTVPGGHTLTITGTIWVGGQIIASNGGTVQLTSSYGADSGVILSDGRVSISNNTTFVGSGTTGSYILLLSTSQCPNDTGCGGAYAIDVSNNVGAVLLDAHYGTLHISNNATAKEATGSKIILDNNATITYESGLADASFSSGPGGSFDITTWREVK